MMNLIAKPNIGYFIDEDLPMANVISYIVNQDATYLSPYANMIVFKAGSKKKDEMSSLSYQVCQSKQLKIPFTDIRLKIPFIDHHFEHTLKQAKLDLVHIHSTGPMGRLGVLYGQKHGIPVIATRYVSSAKPRMLDILNLCDEVWVSNPYAKELSQKEGLKHDPIVMRYATDLNDVFHREKETVLKQKYQIKPDEKILLYVSQSDENQNLHFILESMYRLRIKGFKFKLLMIGQGFDESHIQTDLKKFGLKDRVVIVPEVIDGVERSVHYHLSDLLINLKSGDQLTMAHIEASSQKIPTLALSNSFLSSEITDHRNGYLVEEDSNRVADKIMSIFKNYKLYLKVKEQCFKDLYRSWGDRGHHLYMRYLEKMRQQKKES
jgi:glycosyltransferase involved in cell wall biosynthesis